MPESITINGVEVPTDVLERRYEPAFRVVAEPVTVERKVRLDPIVPGVSVGNVHVSAGTIGGVVYDRADGTPYVLSNWHVLHGPDGDLGDDVVQPGTHDDNRIERNRLGRLVRSHLGIAGDCAVASIEDREFDPAVIELGVVPTELGEPELGDTVVKSGRTTGVTRGIVRRVDTIAKIDYGGTVGVQNIGCFEIGPDPDHPAPQTRSAAAATPARCGCSPRPGRPDGHGRAALRRGGRHQPGRTRAGLPARVGVREAGDLAAAPRRSTTSRTWRATTATSWASGSTSPPSARPCATTSPRPSTVSRSSGTPTSPCR